MSEMNPSTEDFAALLEESFATRDLMEGNVVEGTIVGFEKDLAVIDVGLKVEGPHRDERIRSQGQRWLHEGRRQGRSLSGPG